MRPWSCCCNKCVLPVLMELHTGSQVLATDWLGGPVLHSTSFDMADLEICRCCFARSSSGRCMCSIYWHNSYPCSLISSPFILAHVAQLSFSDCCRLAPAMCSWADRLASCSQAGKVPIPSATL
jgi:hypothetical protein